MLIKRRFPDSSASQRAFLSFRLFSIYPHVRSTSFILASVEWNVWVLVPTLRSLLCKDQKLIRSSYFLFNCKRNLVKLMSIIVWFEWIWLQIKCGLGSFLWGPLFSWNFPKVREVWFVQTFYFLFQNDK